MLTARMFNCALCYKQTFICSSCDRGQCYCSQKCSLEARTQSVKAAKARYQNTYRGKVMHAKRQHCYMQRKRGTAPDKKIMTDHSSQDIANNALLPIHKVMDEKSATSKVTSTVCCYFCGCACSTFLRIEFLNSYKFKKAPKNHGYAQAP